MGDTQEKSFGISQNAIRKKYKSGKKNPREDLIHQQISDAILEQRLKPGTKLTEESLSDVFGVGRTMIRRVLTRLNYENIVEIRPNRGAIVACPTLEQARQVFGARQIIEEAIIRICVQDHTDNDIAGLKNLLQAERDSLVRNDRTNWIRLTGDFHLEIARISGNDIITRFLKDLISQSSLIIALYGRDGGSLCGSSDHAEIVKAIARKDEPAAVSLMAAHRDECADNLAMEEKKNGEDSKTIFSGTV